MSQFVIVNASPRPGGTSAMLAGLCREFLAERGCGVSVVNLYQIADMDAAADALLAADTVILSGPCYVNTYPAPVIRLLEAWAARSPRGTILYGIIQGGMPYMHTHRSGLNLLEVFAEQAGVRYHGGFIIGLGALLDGGSLDKLPNGKKLRRQLAVFFSNIRDGRPSGDEVYEAARMRVPALLAKLMARMMNRMVDKKFARRGMDAYAPSPYQLDELV